MRLLKFLPFICLLIFLSACKVDTEIDLYTTDIKDIDETTILETPSVIKIEVTGCEDNKSQIMEIAKKYFNVSSAPTCSSSDGEDFVEFSAKTPIIFEKEYLPGNIALGILVTGGSGDSRKVSAMLDLSRFSAMESDVKKMDSTASLELNQISVNLSNDARETADIMVPAAFVNNSPEINAMFSLDRRDNARIVVSNVGVAQTSSTGKGLIFEIK